MELLIEKFEVAQAVNFNFEALKADIAETMQKYDNVVYTEDQLPVAKKDLAQMRKFITALDDARKDVKNQLLTPYKEFEAKLNEVKALVEKPIGLIDKQVKDYEQQRKDEKVQLIKDTYEKIELAKPDFDILAQIWNPKWLNSTYKLPNIEDEIRHALVNYANGLRTIEKLTEFRTEAELEYNRTLDIGAALNKQLELKELAQKKAEAAERAKIEAQKAAQEKQPEPEPIPEPEQATMPEPEPRSWIGFEAFVTYSEALELKEFFTTRNITFRKPGGR